jgi:hypothetical protein
MSILSILLNLEPGCHSVGLLVYQPVIVVAEVAKSIDCLQLSTIATPLMMSPVSTSIRSALVNPHWRHTMEE